MVPHVTYRATVTVTLHIKPHECKNRQTVSIGQDMTYLTSICCLEKFPRKVCGILGIGHVCYI